MRVYDFNKFLYGFICHIIVFCCRINAKLICFNNSKKIATFRIYWQLKIIIYNTVFRLIFFCTENFSICRKYFVLTSETLPQNAVLGISCPSYDNKVMCSARFVRDISYSKLGAVKF